MQSLRSSISRIPNQLNHTTRNLTTRPSTMSLFPRFTQEFAPMFRLFDEYERHAFRDLDNQIKSARSFTPKFDVQETPHTYELHGELPGIEQKDVTIEWTDNNTLSISGRHEHVREQGQRPQVASIENGKDTKKLENNRQPTVEDESTNTTTTDSQLAKQPQQDVAETSQQPKYWVSERSVGEFHRSFAFPARVDQDAVKASLKNGILSVVVPKKEGGQRRKVEIE